MAGTGCYVELYIATTMRSCELCAVDDAGGLLAPLSVDAMSRHRLDIVSASPRTTGVRVAPASRSLSCTSGITVELLRGILNGWRPPTVAFSLALAAT